MGGRGLPIPEWATVMEMAETWHQPPWVIEEQLSEEWFERFLAWNGAKAQAQKEQADGSDYA